MVKDYLKPVGRRLFNAVYPNRCLCCGRLIEYPGICSGCDALLHRVPKVTCPNCGRPEGDCECWRNKTRLDGFTAPYYNSGRARTALYNVKFNSAKEGADFFGSRMAQRFKYRFPNVKVDGVCCVPDAHSSKEEKGYYTAFELAKAVAKHMNCPFCPNLLVQVKPSRPQHSLDLKERIKNVKGIYKVNEPVKGKNILVVDDIRTSGATINECGKILAKAKVKSVYGLTAVMSRNLQYF